MTAVERLLQTARAEIGYLEKASNDQLYDKTANAGDKNYTKYAYELDKTDLYHAGKNGYAWCDIFVDWCFTAAFGLPLATKLTCQPLRGYGAGCTESANYYKWNGRFFTNNPQPGDQIFFTNDGGKTMAHTGIVEKVENGVVYTIEGNTSSAPGVVANGGSVNSKSYKIDYARIGGYGRPDYSLVPIEVAEDHHVVEDDVRNSWEHYRKELQDNDSHDWSKEARDWAVRTGLIVGNGTLQEGQPNYMWEDFLTREQAVMLFYRFAQVLGRVN